MPTKQVVFDMGYTYLKNGIKIAVALIPGFPPASKAIEPTLDIVFSHLKLAGLFKTGLSVSQEVELRKIIKKNFNEINKQIPVSAQGVLQRAKPAIESILFENSKALLSPEIADQLTTILKKPIHLEGEFLTGKDFDEVTASFLHLLQTKIDGTSLADTLNRESIKELWAYILEKFDINEKEHREFDRRLTDVETAVSESVGIINRQSKSEIRNDTERFAKSYKSDILFLESYSNDGRFARLSDLFVIPPAFFHVKYVADTEYKKVESSDIINDINSIVMCDDYFTIDGVIHKNVNAMVILGLPGIGKSSITQRLASDYLEGSVFEGKKLFSFRLRDLADQNINIQDPLSSILQYSNISKSELDNSVMILDGLDELCGIQCMEDSIDAFCQNLLKQSSKSFKIIITSRLNYISLSPIEYPHTIFVELRPFMKPQIDKWLTQFLSVHSQENEHIATSIVARFNSCRDETDENEFLRMPLSLYIVMSLRIDLTNQMSLSTIYDRMIDQLKYREYDENKHAIVGKIDFENIAKNIAHKMFSLDKFVLNSEEVREVIGSTEKTLNDEEIDRIGGLYGMSFYFKDGIPQRRSVEFIHRTLSDYVVAWKLCDDLSVCLDDFEEFWNTIDRLLGNNEISPEISDFFIERLEKDIPQKDAFATAFRKYYLDILNAGMIKATSLGVNALDKAAHIFYGYWRLMKSLNPDTDFSPPANEGFHDIEIYLKGLNSKRKYHFNYSFQSARHMDVVSANLSDCNFTGSD